MTRAHESSGRRTYWSRPHLDAALLEAVAAAGLDLGTATPDALAPLDQFHSGGKEATRTLADQAGVAAGMRVLDVGGGLGGPARMLAVEYGARVTVLDLTADYLRAGALLTARMGLAEQVHFCHGQALALPFADGSFDLVWTQNSGMQLADKGLLYRGFWRVLRAGGRLAQLQPVAGAAQQPSTLPVMWAQHAEPEPRACHGWIPSGATHDGHLLAAPLLKNFCALSRTACALSGSIALTIQHLIMGERSSRSHPGGQRPEHGRRPSTT